MRTKYNRFLLTACLPVIGYSLYSADSAQAGFDWNPPERPVAVKEVPTAKVPQSDVMMPEIDTLPMPDELEAADKTAPVVEKIEIEEEVVAEDILEEPADNVMPEMEITEIKEPVIIEETIAEDVLIVEEPSVQEPEEDIAPEPEEDIAPEPETLTINPFPENEDAAKADNEKIVLPQDSEKNIAEISNEEAAISAPEEKKPESPQEEIIWHTYDVIEGFGKDTPLVLALRQIVPAKYAFVFGENVKPGTLVSWEGGKPWNQVLEASLNDANMNFEISGSSVHLSASAPKAAEEKDLEVFMDTPDKPEEVTSTETEATPEAMPAPIAEEEPEIVEIIEIVDPEPEMEDPAPKEPIDAVEEAPQEPVAEPAVKEPVIVLPELEEEAAPEPEDITEDVAEDVVEDVIEPAQDITEDVIEEAPEEEKVIFELEAMPEAEEAPQPANPLDEIYNPKPRNMIQSTPDDNEDDAIRITPDEIDEIEEQLLEKTSIERQKITDPGEKPSMQQDEALDALGLPLMEEKKNEVTEETPTVANAAPVALSDIIKIDPQSLDPETSEPTTLLEAPSEQTVSAVNEVIEEPKEEDNAEDQLLELLQLTPTTPETSSTIEPIISAPVEIKAIEDNAASDDMTPEDEAVQKAVAVEPMADAKTYNKEPSNKVRVWQAKKGANLQKTLTVWAEEENIELVWEASKDKSLRLDKDVFISGTFENALEVLFSKGMKSAPGYILKTDGHYALHIKGDS